MMSLNDNIELMRKWAKNTGISIEQVASVVIQYEKEMRRRQEEVKRKEFDNYIRNVFVGTDN